MTNHKQYSLREAQLIMLKALIELDSVCKKHDIHYWLDAGTLLGAVRHSGFIPWDDDIDICMLRQDYEKLIKIASKSINQDLFFLQTKETDPSYPFVNIPCKLRVNNTNIIEDFEIQYECYDANSHHGLFIDIFPYDKYSIDKIKRKQQRFFSNYYKLHKLSYCHNIGFSKFLASRIFKHLVPLSFLEKVKNKKVQQMNNDPKNTVYGAGIETPFSRAYFTENELFPLQEITFEGHSFSCPNKTHDYLVKMFGIDYMTPPSIQNQQSHGKIA